MAGKVVGKKMSRLKKSNGMGKIPLIDKFNLKKSSRLEDRASLWICQEERVLRSKVIG
jgi:hypothetical protein